jgi:hypothetical protein
MGKKTVPYFAEFDIALVQIESNYCKVTVRTTSSRVHDGKEIGIHGGWAARSKSVPPILAEESNVVARIESQLKASAIPKGNGLQIPKDPAR